MTRIYIACLAAYNNGILRSLQTEAQSFMRSSKSAGGLSGAGGPPAKRPMIASNRGNSAAAKVAAAAAAAGGGGRDSASNVVGDATQRPKAAPSGRSALFPRLKQN